jgi:hypothetical protein
VLVRRDRAPWYAIILYKEGAGFVQGFFIKHNVSRFSGPLQGHAGSLVLLHSRRAGSDAAFHGAAGERVLAHPTGVARRSAMLSAALVRVRLRVLFAVGHQAAALRPVRDERHVRIDGLYVPASRLWALAPAAIWFVFLLVLPSVAEWARRSVPMRTIEKRWPMSRAASVRVLPLCGDGSGVTPPSCSTGACAHSQADRQRRALVVGLAVFLVPIGAAVQQSRSSKPRCSRASVAGR